MLQNSVLLFCHKNRQPYRQPKTSLLSHDSWRAARTTQKYRQNNSPPQTQPRLNCVSNVKQKVFANQSLSDKFTSNPWPRTKCQHLLVWISLRPSPPIHAMSHNIIAPPFLQASPTSSSQKKRKTHRQKPHHAPTTPPPITPAPVPESSTCDLRIPTPAVRPFTRTQPRRRTPSNQQTPRNHQPTGGSNHPSRTIP